MAAAMKTYIALLRGINMGGHNLLSMKALQQTLEEMGLKKIRTYKQSGNVIFQSKIQRPLELTKRVAAAIKEKHGLSPKILLLDRHEWDATLEKNPFPGAESDPKSLHVIFLVSVPPRPDLKVMEKIKGATEQFALIGNLFYLYAPDGVGRSKLASRVEKALGVEGTGRNWRTVMAISEMAKELEEGC